MKGQRVEVMVYEGVNDFIHGGGETLQRIFLPQAGGLLLGVHNGEPIVTKCLEAPGKVVGHVDLPHGLLPILQEYLEAESTLKNALEGYFPQT